MEVKSELTINAPADKVWKVIGTDFNDIAEWSSVVLTSEANPDVPVGHGRICEVQKLGKLVENITSYDEENREVKFTVEGNTPFFVKRVQNTWRVQPQTDGTSLVHISADVKLLPVFNLLSGGLSKVFQKRTDFIMSELRYFAENGKAHSDKQARLDGKPA